MIFRHYRSAFVNATSNPKPFLVSAKTMVMQNPIYIPSGLTVYLVVTALLSNARRRKSRRKGNTNVFDGSAMLRALLVVFIIGFAAAALYVSVNPPRSVLGTTLFAFIALAGLFGFPSPIFLGPKSVEQHFWWGGNITMNWNDVVHVEFHKGPTTTVIRDHKGRKIIHSGFHCDTQLFLDLCQKNAHTTAVISQF